MVTLPLRLLLLLLEEEEEEEWERSEEAIFFIGSYNPNRNPPYVAARKRDGVNPT